MEGKEKGRKRVAGIGSWVMLITVYLDKIRVYVCMSLALTRKRPSRIPMDAEEERGKEEGRDERRIKGREDGKGGRERRKENERK